jgi:GT2 family glycosyltransferase
VARAYPTLEGAAAAGFNGFIELGKRPLFFGTLEVWARFASGRRACLFRRRLGAIGPLVMGRLGRSYRAIKRRDQAPATTTDLARAHRSLRDAELQAFLSSGSRLVFEECPEPVVTAVVVVWNHAALSFGCLRALRQARIPLELVIVDNGSTDQTDDLLERIDGVTVRRNQSNLGFPAAINQGAAAARGTFLLFINNDLEVLPGAIEHLVEQMSDESIGAVGGKLVWPTGLLQEAGSIIWSDGSCLGYGRGGDPAAPEFTFARDVDFCSAALLLTRRDLFVRLGGFDEEYRPIYYEDVDYCVRVWKSGSRVVFEPRATAIHGEFASSTGVSAVERLQLERRPIFVGKHRDWLRGQLAPGTEILRARIHPHVRPAVLCIDDIVPRPERGSGFPRAAVFLKGLESAGYVVTVFPTNGADSDREPFCAGTTEVMSGIGPTRLAEFLSSRDKHYAGVIVSRPHNLRFLKAAVGKDLARLSCPVIYDAEAVYAIRDVLRDRLMGVDVPVDAEARRVEQEIALASGCTAVVTVTDDERARFLAAGFKNVCTLGHSVDVRRSVTDFSDRKSLLFVGGFGGNGPNEDALEYLLQQIQPALNRSGKTYPLVVAGSRLAALADRFSGADVTFASDVRDLGPFYSDARVFVAPTRFAAGLPLKIVEAASRGIPVVCTPLLARQLGWTKDRELLTASTPDEFAREVTRLYESESLWTEVREAALARVRVEHGAGQFDTDLRRVLTAAGMD